MKKVAFIIQKLTNGGAERTISNLSLLLKDQCDVYIIVYNGSNMTYPYAGTLLDLALPPKDGAVHKIFNLLRRVKAVRKLKKEYNFDCVISFMFGGNVVNVLSGGKTKIVTSARNFISVYGTGPIQQIRERFIAAKSDKVVALSRMVEVDLNDTFRIPKSKTMTIYNPCDIERVKELAKMDCPLLLEDAFYFVSAGRMSRQKGQWHLIKAFLEVYRKSPDSRLIILGTGELELKLKELAFDLGISDVVVFTGFEMNPYTFMSHSDCFVLSSLHEGLGNVILEAMACGLPVISMDCLAGPREIIAPESDIRMRAEGIENCSCGILTPSDDSEFWNDVLTAQEKLLAEAMLMAKRDSGLREQLAENARRRLNEFSNEKIVKDWMDLIG